VAKFGEFQVIQLLDTTLSGNCCLEGWHRTYTQTFSSLNSSAMEYTIYCIVIETVVSYVHSFFN
jgi:hypothetical protein